MKKKFVIVFIFTINIDTFINNHKAEAVDCLTINASSSQSDKDICRNELAKYRSRTRGFKKSKKLKRKILVL